MPLEKISKYVTHEALSSGDESMYVFFATYGSSRERHLNNEFRFYSQRDLASRSPVMYYCANLLLYRLSSIF